MGRQETNQGVEVRGSVENRMGRAPVKERERGEEGEDWDEGVISEMDNNRDLSTAVDRTLRLEEEGVEGNGTVVGSHRDLEVVIELQRWS
jgi:hypothetical protein